MSADWPRVPLEEVLTHRKEFIQIDDVETYKRCRVQLHAQGIVLRDEVPGAEIKTKKQQVCQAGEFLVAEIDAKVGGFGIVPEHLNGAIVSSHYFLFGIDTAKLDRRFLDFFIRTPVFREQVEAQGSTNYAAIRPAHVLGYTVPLPPLAEQRQIVARVEAVADRVAEARRLRDEADCETMSIIGHYLRTLLSGELPEVWKRGRLSDVVMDCCYGTSERTTDDPSGVPVLRMGNIQDGRLDFANLKYLPLTSVSKDSLVLQKGDILVNRTNSAELVGKCAVFDRPERFSFASYLIRIRVDTLLADPWFVTSYINSPLGREYMFAERRQMTGQANVNSKKLLALPVTIPPLPEQRRIVAHLDTLQAKADALRSLQSETASELDALLPAVLAKAFAGEL